jgi:hypothetical protein
MIGWVGRYAKSSRVVRVIKSCCQVYSEYTLFELSKLRSFYLKGNRWRPITIGKIYHPISDITRR